MEAARSGAGNEKTPTFVRGGGECGAGDEIRTRDIYLGKVVLYQLSYSRVESCKRGTEAVFRH